MNTGAHIRDDLPRDGTRLADSLVALAAAVGTRPVEALQSLHRSGAALLDVAIGRSTVEPAAGDRRFDDPAWQGNPLYRGLMHSHLALVREAQRLAGELDLSPRDEARTRMALGMVADTLAPTNTLLGNPAALRRTLDTGGRNLLDGARNLVTDWRDNGGLPAMVDGTAFGVGENLAVTPGSVVYRHAMLELVQYRPQTQKVHGTPLFIVPPQINKYYIWDLAPGRSLIEHLVQQGFQVFVVSWFDPGAEQSGWGLEDYVLALEEAMQAVRDISRAPQMHVLGACSGGITASALLAYLAAKGSDWARSLTLLVSLLDVQGIADSSMGLFAHLETLELARTASGGSGVLQGKDLAKVFAWLRPNELIWNYWVNNYLMGEKPPTFDVLYWNSDTTRLPARLHADFIALLETNALAHEGGLSIGELPLSLANVGCDSYIVAGRTDHITPWEGCYQTRRMLGGHSEFVLTSSGHVQSIVTPPGGKKASFLTNTGAHDTPERFESGGQANEGSWWPHLTAWLAARSDAQKRAPAREGSRDHPALCAAPGTYVLGPTGSAAE
ncbi:alpha/beta fold hydrolase [Variovorax sp. J31P179]|uniref:alpha/beta fold hydrolase n=1 Tax=Variovorax sp. J31P179 TaxID=3053508 RepID=UPI0025770871|nr:alpha/beta fold hydrolase [Variovorax sp. J31P179]MDM0079520.1 alpha/beta fold hydrolase [Variovorax sp. J31P179]